MPPTRGPYNITTAKPPLTDAQLGFLTRSFNDHRKALPCPNCKTTSTFRSKGTASDKHHNEPHYKCLNCSHTVYAAEMLIMINNEQPMDEANQSPAAQPPATVASQPVPNINSHPELPTNSQPDLQMLFNMIAQLTTQMQQQQNLIVQLTEELHQLKQAPPTVPATNNLPINAETEFPPLPSAPSKYSSAPWHQPQRGPSLAQIVSKNREKREATAARFFQAPSTTQGFQYLYLPTKARIPLGKLRTTFKKLGVNNGRLLDLHYPDRNIVAVLVHNDYASELTELLTKKGIKLNTTFDPRAATVLKDPKYANDTVEQRQQTAQQLHNQRIQKALIHIRGPAKFAVARFFAHKTWITKEQLEAILATDPYLTQTTDPIAEDIFLTEDNASVVSATSNMEEDLSSPAEEDSLTTMNQ